MTIPTPHPRSRGATTLLVIVAVFALSIITIAYIRSAAKASRDASAASISAEKTSREVKAAIARLNYASRRADCIRDVQGDAEQEFRRTISALFDANQNPVIIDQIRKRLREQPAWTDTAKRICPA
jgi:Tfp pilus assembly protein PilE